MLRPPPRSSPRRSPTPTASRRVWCPKCDHMFDASAKALSLRCPRCTHGLVPRDVDLTESVNGDISVNGRVNVPTSMKLIGRLTCAELTSNGQFSGAARVGGAVRLEADSFTHGEIVCRSLHMSKGARFHARAVIGAMDDDDTPPTPRATPPALARLIHPASQPAR